jgi:hypothetical protein
MKIETQKPAEDGMGYYVAELEEPADSGKDPWGAEWYRDIDEWCKTTFGHQDLWGEEPCTGWKRMRNKYFFVDEDKLAWFLLRWL